MKIVKEKNNSFERTSLKKELVLFYLDMILTTNFMYKGFFIGKTIIDRRNVKGGISMRNRKINRMNKEKIAMIVSSLLIVTACTLTGVYINGKEKAKEKEQVVDFAELEGTENQTAKQEEIVTEPDVVVPQQVRNDTFVDQDLDVDPMYQETNSDSIINPEFSTNAVNTEADGEEKNSGDAKNANVEEKENTDVDENASPESDEEKRDTETIGSSVALFSESEKLSWPVQGEVLMNYSMDKTVYFATLNQYKYNPALVIKAEPEMSVKAPYNGTVKETGSNAEIGNYVVMDLGNGYELTLGQLENLSVSKGDVVKNDQVVGKTASPTKYYSVEGSNIYMKLTKDGNAVNPMNFLES